VAYSQYVYCLGATYGTGVSAAVSYARETNPGLTPFLSTTNYPQLGEFGQYSCVAGIGRIYCVDASACQSAGPPPTGCRSTNAVYFADIIPSPIITIFILNKGYSRYFYPQNLTVFVGVNNTVRWYDGVGADVLNIMANDGSFSTGVIRSSNFSKTITFYVPGTYSYRGIGPSANGPTDFGGGTIRVISAIVVTTTKVYTFTTTATRISTSTTTTTSISTSTTTSIPTPTAPGSFISLGGEIITVTAVAVAAVAGAWVGSRLKRRT